MRQHITLLERLINMWNEEGQYFQVSSNILMIEVEDIYFLTGLSRQNSFLSPTGNRGGGESTKVCIATYCHAIKIKSSGKIPIKDVTNIAI